MNKERLKYLFEQYKKQDLSPIERQEWATLIHDPNLDDDLKEILEEEWYEYELPELQLLDVNKADQIYHNIIDEKPKTEKRHKLWSRIAVAAVLTLTAVGIYFSNSNKNTDTSNTHLIAQDIAPGNVGATLTLSDGTTIKLSDAANGQIAKVAGVLITKSADGQLVYEIKEDSGDINKFNTLTTAKGETYQIRLPDGSMVWLNAASKLTYSAKLKKDGKRWVKLEGEGYFEIVKDKEYPFVVESKGQKIEVLGTHFNVNAYEDEPTIATTLIEGSIRIKSDQESKILSPGQQALSIAGNKNINVINNIDIQKILAWKNGFFSFNNTPAETMLKQISRWYDVEIVITEKLPEDFFNGKISRSESLSQVIKVLKLNGLNLKIEGRKLIVEP